MHIHYSKLLYSISDTNAHEVKTCQFKKIKRSLIYCKFNLNIVQTTLNVSLPASKHPVLLLLSNVMVSTLGEFCPSGLLHATATNANTKQLKKSAQRSKQCFFLTQHVSLKTIFSFIHSRTGPLCCCTVVTAHLWMVSEKNSFL